MGNFPALAHFLKTTELISTFSYDFALFCYAIFRICYSLIFPGSRKMEKFPAPAHSPKTTKLVSKFSNEFAAFCYAIFSVCYSLVFPENGKFPSTGTFSKNH